MKQTRDEKFMYPHLFKRSCLRVSIFLLVLFAAFSAFTSTAQAHSSSSPHPPLAHRSPKVHNSPKATNTGTSVVLVHGLNTGNGSEGSAAKGDNTMPGCDNYWTDTINFLSNRWAGDVRQVGYYTYDCYRWGNGTTPDLTYYSPRCANFYAGNNGTNNENLGHVACELDWYLYYNFGQYGWQEILVGHSMGGLIVRKALQLVQNHDPAVPSNIGNVTDAITLNTPLVGQIGAGFVCGLCLQGSQEEPNNGFIQSLNNYTHIDIGGHTDWTTVSSDCQSNSYGDQYVSRDSAVALNEDHKVVYNNWSNTIGCDSHGGIIHHIDPNFDASTFYCDNYDLSTPSNCSTDLLDIYSMSTSVGNWSYNSGQPCGVNEIYYALSSYYW